MIVFLDLPEYEYWGVNTSCISGNVQDHCPSISLGLNGHSDYINTIIFGTFGISSYRSLRVVMVQDYSQCTARVMSLTAAVIL